MLDNAEVLYIVLIVLCVMLSAFFSSSETAFISLQKLRLRHLANTNVSSARKVIKMTERPEKLLTAILLGNNFVNTAAAALATVAVVAILDNSTEATQVLIATGSITALLLVFGEIAPKTLATRHGERMALLYAKPMGLLMRLLYPLVLIFVWVGSGLARLIGGPTLPQALISEDEIRSAISAGVEEGTLEKGEAELLNKVFRFGDCRVAEVMTPRPDISWVEQGTNLSQFLATYADSPHSRFPVCMETTDNITGVLWIKDVLMALAKGKISEESPIDELARPAYFIPESKLVAELFSEMQEKGNQVAVIVDEFGGTAGLVTTEQLVEEIVGEVGDELAKRRKGFEAIDENTFEVDGGMRIEQANEELGLNLPEGQYETISGFALELLGHIPEEGEQVKYADLRLTISEVKGVKIEKILITRIADAATSHNLQQE
ncbi:hemolysin family protein [Chloroflexota bacterium]